MKILLEVIVCVSVRLGQALLTLFSTVLHFFVSNLTLVFIRIFPVLPTDPEYTDYSVTDAYLWSTLPDDIKNANSTTIFK